MSREEALGIVAAMGVDPERPLITQVSRFDYWKDPWGVIDAYRQARQEAPGLQLALLGLSQAADDPEALDVLNSITEYAAGDPDIHSYFYPTDLPDTIDRIVNAFQTASLVVMQKSMREGFGLTVSEAMWKSRAVIGGNVGGIRVQIEDGVNGYLVDSPAECGRRIVQLLQSPELRESIGKAARERVRREFLLPRLALDYLQAARAGLPELPRRYTNGANGHHPTAFDQLEQLRDFRFCGNSSLKPGDSRSAGVLATPSLFLRGWLLFALARNPGLSHLDCRLSVVPAQAGTSVLNVLGSCLRRNDGKRAFSVNCDCPGAELKSIA